MQNLATSVENGEKIGQTTTATLKETIDLLPSNLIVPLAKAVLIIDTASTPAKMYVPSLDPAEFAFITGNTVTKI